MDYNLIEQLLGLPRIKISHIEQHDNEILIWIYIVSERKDLID